MRTKHIHLKSGVASLLRARIGRRALVIECSEFDDAGHDVEKTMEAIATGLARLVLNYCISHAVSVQFVNLLVNYLAGASSSSSNFALL